MTTYILCRLLSIFLFGIVGLMPGGLLAQAERADHWLGLVLIVISYLNLQNPFREGPRFPAGRMHGMRCTELAIQIIAK